MWINPNRADADQRLIPMLVSPYLSPESRAICTDHNVRVSRSFRERPSRFR